MPRSPSARWLSSLGAVRAGLTMWRKDKKPGNATLRRVLRRADEETRDAEKEYAREKSAKKKKKKTVENLPSWTAVKHLADVLEELREFRGAKSLTGEQPVPPYIPLLLFVYFFFFSSKTSRYISETSQRLRVAFREFQKCHGRLALAVTISHLQSPSGEIGLSLKERFSGARDCADVSLYLSLLSSALFIKLAVSFHRLRGSGRKAKKNEKAKIK